MCNAGAPFRIQEDHAVAAVFERKIFCNIFCFFKDTLELPHPGIEPLPAIVGIQLRAGVVDDEKPRLCGGGEGNLLDQRLEMFVEEILLEDLEAGQGGILAGQKEVVFGWTDYRQDTIVGLVGEDGLLKVLLAIGIGDSAGDHPAALQFDNPAHRAARAVHEHVHHRVRDLKILRRARHGEQQHDHQHTGFFERK